MKITPNQFSWIFVIVLLTLMGWGGWKAYLFFRNPADVVLSIENEKKLGDYLEQQSFNEANGYHIIHGAYSDSCIREIHERLMMGLQGSGYTYDLKLIDQEVANAFAIPGGKIFIHSGLILFCKSPEEVAAVLAHEMGHVEKRHTVNNLIKTFGMNVLLSIASDGNGSSLENVSSQLLSNYFSREDESEADDFALDLLEKCHIDPRNLGIVFSRMKLEYGDMEGAMNLLSTHPELDQRAALSSAYQTKEGFQIVPITMDWNRFQSELNTNP